MELTVFTRLLLSIYVCIFLLVKEILPSPMCLCNKDVVRFKIRQKPGSNERVVGLIKPGQCLLVIGGPISIGRYEWYIVRKTRNAFIAKGPWLKWKKCGISSRIQRKTTQTNPLLSKQTKIARIEISSRRLPRTYSNNNEIDHISSGDTDTYDVQSPYYRDNTLPHEGRLPPLTPDRVRIAAPIFGKIPIRKVKRLFRTRERKRHDIRIRDKIHSLPLYEVDADETSETYIPDGPIGKKCLDCICELESNCSPIGCNMDLGSLSCGYYQLKKNYYIDCGSPGSGWKECGNDKRCSEKCMYNYMNRYVSKCYADQDREPTCEDYSRIHNGGPSGCTSRRWFTNVYWRKMKRCMAR